MHKFKPNRSLGKEQLGNNEKVMSPPQEILRLFVFLLACILIHRNSNFGDTETPERQLSKVVLADDNTSSPKLVKRWRGYLDLAFRFFQLGLRETVSKGRDRHPLN
ncbi:hypothetical protein OUZ56_000906 [Daphnia magna]|uniref:Uncharacterized protein n=1 Tax=Daphnia magna TaxID=35525 RepID=A0ABR0A179_9CRUS|nr:hypothetical protein OUZ56_000906 [Daphnia magna]